MKKILFLAFLCLSMIPIMGHAVPGQSGAGPKVGEGSSIDRSNSTSNYYRSDREREREAHKQIFRNRSTLGNETRDTHRNNSYMGNDTIESGATQNR